MIAEKIAPYDRVLKGYTTNGCPGPGQAVEVLCRDHVGTYALPFLCRHDDSGWHKEEGQKLEVTVIGWRQRKFSRSFPR